MINENIIEKLSERLGNRADKANIVFLKEIGNIIKSKKNKKDVNYLDSYYKVINKVKKITEQNINDLFSILNAIAKDIKKDVKQYYEYRGIKYTPYDEDIQAQIAVERLFIPIMEEYKAQMNEYNLGTAIKENRIVYNNINQTFNRVISDGNLYQDLSEEEYYYRMQETEKQFRQQHRALRSAFIHSV